MVARRFPRDRGSYDARIVVALLLTAACLAPSTTSAQSLQSFGDLALRTNLGDRLWIEDEAGTRTTGRLTRLMRDDIAIRTDAGVERRFTSATVREISVRRQSHRKGVLIGAGAGAAIGALAACVGRDRSECVDGPIVLGAVGAGLGFAASALDSRVTTIYRAPMDTAASRGQTRPPGPFDDLALRVNLDDRLRVEDQAGVRTTGRLTRLTGDEMAIETDAGEKRFTAAMVREVAVRSYSLGKGALIGTAAFAVLAAAAPACRSNPDCIPIAAAPLGAGVGLAVGALIPQMTTVFRAHAKGVSLSPAFSRGTIGIRVTLNW